jgi:hypothetical protein
VPVSRRRVDEQVWLSGLSEILDTVRSHGAVSHHEQSPADGSADLRGTHHDGTLRTHRSRRWHVSTGRRLFEDPRNTYIVGNDDPDAFDKRFVGRPGVHREQQCCGNRAPVWQTHLLHDDQDPDDDNPLAYQYSVGLQVEDATGESDHVTGRNETKGYVWVEGPTSGFRPEFVSPTEWMRWQGVHWMPSPRADYPAGLPNGERWVRTPGERKVRRGDSWELEYLWCQRCETALESAWSDFLDKLPVVARGIAMIASWVPVFGTALSIVLTATVALAEGESIDDAALEVIGNTLPGQPATRFAFTAAVAIGRGERVDKALIRRLPIDKSLIDVILVADDVLYGIAEGARLTDLAYQAARDQLPPDAQRVMDSARRVANGESLPDMVLTEAEQEALDRLTRTTRSIVSEASGQGADALQDARALADSYINQYAIECGYQVALDLLPQAARGSVQMGLVAGATWRTPEPAGIFGFQPETNVVENERSRVHGEALIRLGVSYRGRPVGDLLASGTLHVVIDEFDLLNQVWVRRPKSFPVTDAFRRGFAVAMAVCQGSSVNGPGQMAVYHTLAEVGGRDGFLAGQAVQFDRTLHGDSGLTDTEVAKADQDLQHVRAAAPDFVGLSPATALALAAEQGVDVEFAHAEGPDDVFGQDLQTLVSGDGGDLRPHVDAEIVVFAQRPEPGSALEVGAHVRLGVSLAPGVL